VSTGIISGSLKYFKGAKVEIHDTGSNEGTENKNRTAKSVNILLGFKILKVIFIVA